MPIDLGQQRRPVGVSHRHTKTRAVHVVGGQVMGLAIVHRLDEVFEAPQEPVRRQQLSGALRRQAARADQPR